MTKARAPAWKTEAEMCAAFLSNLPKEWTGYAETAGWDILLVRTDGLQVGVEAKLRLNIKVVDQALGGWSSIHSADVGPDCRAVLVPFIADHPLQRICGRLGVTVLTVMEYERGRVHIYPLLPRPDVFDDAWHEWWPARRCPVPDYVPDVAAGASSPTKLTEWKIAALKVLVLLERQGFVTRADFRFLHIDHRRWTAPHPGWLSRGERPGEWVAGSLPDIASQHPAILAQVRADFPRWCSVDHHRHLLSNAPKEESR